MGALESKSQPLLSRRQLTTRMIPMSEKREKVVVAMSGGVDSSVAACLLKERGYEVLGLFMRVGVEEPATSCKTDDESSARSHQGCCSASDAADARFVAGMLDVPFYALNFKSDFDELIDYFADEYVRGRTPNPCVVCNTSLKFGKIVDYADAVGAKYIATGHYARIVQQDGRAVLARGVDHAKDQSYVLFGLDRKLLDRLLFPVGDLVKDEVRKIAARLDLPNRDKPDSVEICFVPDRNYARVVQERRPEAFAEGDVLDQSGEVIGRHKGIAHYTVGQRRGLGIAAGTPIYVTSLNSATNTVTIGDNQVLLADALEADRVNYMTPDKPTAPFRALVKIRYLHKATPATVIPLNHIAPPQSAPEPRASARAVLRPEDRPPTENAHPTGHRVRVEFDEPQRAITPGQAVVFYDEDVVIGGGWIDKAVPSSAGV